MHVDARVQTKSNTPTLIEGQITHVACVQLDLQSNSSKILGSYKFCPSLVLIGLYFKMLAYINKVKYSKFSNSKEDNSDQFGPIIKCSNL